MRKTTYSVKLDGHYGYTQFFNSLRAAKTFLKQNVGVEMWAIWHYQKNGEIIAMISNLTTKDTHRYSLDNPTVYPIGFARAKLFRRFKKSGVDKS